MHLLAIGIALLVSYFVCTLVHELAHLLATWAVGWKPFTLSLGYGRRRTLFQIGDVRFQIGSQPFGGFVEFVALKPSYFRLKWFVIVAAGPFATAMLFLFIYSTLRWPLPETWRIAVQSLLVGEAASLLFCLWPMRFDFGGMSLSNDGLQMWQAVRMKRGEIPELFTSHVMEHVQRLLETGRAREAQKLVDQTMADLGAPSTLDQKILYLHVLMLCGREGAANGVLDELLSTGTPPGLTRSQFLDTLACFPLFFRYGHLIPRAIAWADEAIRLEPDRITCKGTKGSLLVESGEFEAGLELLEEVRRVSTLEDDQAISSYYIALAHHRMGHTAKAEEELHQARANYPTCIVADSISRTIRGT